MPLVTNDDVLFPVNKNARVVFTPDRDGVYRLVVNGYMFREKPAGDYVLHLQEVVPAGKPILFEAELNPAPHLDKQGNLKPASHLDMQGKFFNEHRVDLAEGVPYVVELRSQRFDTFWA
jgi:hypothetical protein